MNTNKILTFIALLGLSFNAVAQDNSHPITHDMVKNIKLMTDKW